MVINSAASASTSHLLGGHEIPPLNPIDLKTCLDSSYFGTENSSHFGQSKMPLRLDINSD